MKRSRARRLKNKHKRRKRLTHKSKAERLGNRIPKKFRIKRKIRSLNRFFHH